MSSSQFRRLVVVRAGDASLHPQWLGGSEPATFDLAVSYYGIDPNAFAEARLRHIAKGGKWDGLHAFFADNPGLLDKYDWIWLPDDDIATTTACINCLFALAEEHALDIAQPSLTWDSYYTFFITLQNPGFRLRWTNFVEVMVPVFSSAMLRKILPICARRRFGWGLDFLWARWMSEPIFRAAIIDAVSVRHTRPVGKGNLYRGARNAQETERDELLNEYALGRPPAPVVYAGLDTHGRLLKRGLRLWATLYAGWAPLSRLHSPTGRFPTKSTKLIKHARKMVLGSLDLTPLPLPSELPSRK